MTFYAGRKEEGKELRAFASTRLLNESMEPIRGCGGVMREYCSRILALLLESSLRSEGVARRDPGRDPKDGRRHGGLCFR